MNINLSNEEKLVFSKYLIERGNRENVTREDREHIQELLEQCLDIDLRICTKCGELMYKGYCFEEAGEWYCSDECLHKEMTKEEYDEYYKNDVGYYTEWV